ncbi:MAG: hypothetical protein ACWGQW_05310 [bacterium]
MSHEPDLIWDSSEYENPDEEMWAYEDLTSELTLFMKDINPDGQWRALVENFGWMNQNGHASITAHNGVDLLQGVLPRTQCTFKVWMDKEGKKITIDNAHHDKPTGGEMYYITPQENEDV